MTTGHERDPKVLKMVRTQLTRRKSPPNVKALYGRAVRINAEIRELSLRQFNALYPLQVRREMKRKERREARARKASEERPSPGSENGVGTRDDLSRAAVRAELLAFAGAVADADSRADLIDLVRDLDAWIDRVRAAAVPDSDR